MGDGYINLSNGSIVTIKRLKAIKYYKLAEFVANEFSVDESTKVGALFVYPDTLQIMSVGYNGMPRGIDEKKQNRWERPLKYKFTEHAERNAIYNAAQCGIPLKDSICIVSMFPCAECARGIIQSGCKMVISFDFNDYVDPNDIERIKRWREDWDISMEILKEANVSIMLLRSFEIVRG